MKKFLSIFLLVLMLLTCTTASAAAPISVEVNARELTFDVAPINQRGRILVPVRAIFEALGATVDWNQATETVTSTLNGTTIALTINNVFMMINGNAILLDVPPVIRSERTLVPVRAVSEAFDAAVSWDAENNRVEIFTDDFLNKPEDLKLHTAEKALTDGSNTANASFDISYPDKYEVFTNAESGLDFNILSSSDSYFADLSVRTDLYTGSPMSMTDSYAESLAESIVSAVGGKFISGELTTIGGKKFVEVRYQGIADSNTLGSVTTDVRYYTTTNNGVVYTMTYISYGDVPTEVSADMNYTMSTLIIR